MTKLGEILNKAEGVDNSEAEKAKEKINKYLNIIEQIIDERDSINEVLSRYEADDEETVNEMYWEGELNRAFKRAERNLLVLKECYKKLTAKLQE